MSVTITRIKIAGDQTGNVAEVDASNHLLVTSASQGPVTPGTAATSSTLIGGQFNAVLPTLTDTQQSALQLDSNGRLITVADRTWNLDSTTDNVGAVQFGTWAFILKNPSGNADYNFGTVGILTLRTAAIIGNATGAANFNYGVVGAQTLRTASQIGNATGAADFGAGATGAQTLRVTANQGTSPWITSASNFPTTLDTNYGTVGASTLRTASQIGNATGAALFGAGTTTAQVLRVVLPTDQTAIPASQSGNWSVRLQDGAGTALTSTLVSAKQALDVNVVNTNGVQDKAIFTYGTSTDQIIGGVYQDTSPQLTAGQSGAVRLSQHRAFHANLRDDVGNQLLGQKVMAGSLPTVLASDQVGATAVGTVSAVNGAVTLNNTSQFSTFGVQISGTWSGSLMLEASWDNVIWFGLYAFDTTLGYIYQSVTANGSIVTPGGTPFFRIRASTWTSGTANITVSGNWGNHIVQCVSPFAGSFYVTNFTRDASGNNIYADFGASNNALRVAALLGNANGSANFGSGVTGNQTLRVVIATDQTVIPVGGEVASGATDSGNPIKVGAVFNTTLPTFTNGQRGNLQIDANGRLLTSVGTKATYSAIITNLASVATATDIFTITGSATKTVKITNIRISATQTTAGSVNILLIKRSTANTVGTSTTPTVVAYDSNDPAGTAVVRAYTANPTLGTAVGTMRSQKMFTATALLDSDNLEWIFGRSSGAEPIVLRGTAQVLAINLNSITIAGSSFNISIEWMEE